MNSKGKEIKRKIKYGNKKVTDSLSEIESQGVYVDYEYESDIEGMALKNVIETDNETHYPKDFN